MKNLPLACALLVLFGAPATFAQSAPQRYHYSNFDTTAGVNVELPPAPKPKPAPSARKTRLTARVVEAKPLATVPAPAPAREILPTPVTTMTASKSLDGFSTGDPRVDAFIVESGTRNGVDPVLLYSIMHRESSFKKTAVSNKGARGLMQLMPATAARFGVRDIFDPRQNIEGGTRYIRFLLNMFGGDVRLALAGYNAGEGAVLKYGGRVPPYSETQEYVRRIMQRYTLMRDPLTARRAITLTPAQVADIKPTGAVPTGNLYERNVYAVRMPDGKLRLVSQ